MPSEAACEMIGKEAYHMPCISDSGKVEFCFMGLWLMDHDSATHLSSGAVPGCPGILYVQTKLLDPAPGSRHRDYPILYEDSLK